MVNYLSDFEFSSLCNAYLGTRIDLDMSMLFGDYNISCLSNEGDSLMYNYLVIKEIGERLDSKEKIIHKNYILQIDPDFEAKEVLTIQPYCRWPCCMEFNSQKVPFNDKSDTTPNKPSFDYIQLGKIYNGNEWISYIKYFSNLTPSLQLYQPSPLVFYIN